MNRKLTDITNQEIIFFIIDLLASEYGWDISYIQNLTIPEISGLLRCIFKRKGIDLGEAKTSKTDQREDLIKLASQLGATTQQLEALKKGQKVIL